ncbi:homoserine kinase [Weissella uvarum]|uniref:homoserine kinase n=1 Tax=Weissella uvarum TaxID=1479233 RepID=UPI001960767A|nr:homoserine kinase [Weissella uvarum]MBM7617179.1 homoserine kinase [Weissella uvarum]MCM0595475.1 homoserine kinase [Weissella uvarum]
MEIFIPATLANFGPGMGSMGIPLSVGLTIEVGAPTQAWTVTDPFDGVYGINEKHYMVQIANNLAPQITPHAIEIKADLPTWANMGVQDALILGGIELANQLGQLNLDDFTKLTLAARTAQDPAHVAAALLGQPTVSYLEQGDVYASGFVFPQYGILLYIPENDATVKTPVPESVSYTDAVAANAGGNMLMAAWQNQQVQLAGQLLENDHLQPEAPENKALLSIRQAAHALGVYGTVLLEKGPLVGTFVAPEQMQDLQDVLAYVALDGYLEPISMGTRGITVN